MREAMERQCESHALLCMQIDDFHCDVFIGVGCLDDNGQTSTLCFEALPVEGYVYVDSVPVNMTPCVGIQELQSVCTKVPRTWASTFRIHSLTLLQSSESGVIFQEQCSRANCAHVIVTLSR